MLFWVIVYACMHKHFVWGGSILWIDYWSVYCPIKVKNDRTSSGQHRSVGWSIILSPKGVGSIPGQGIYVGCGFDPWSRCVWEATSQCFSLSLPLSLKQWKNSLRWRFKIFFSKNAWIRWNFPPILLKIWDSVWGAPRVKLFPMFQEICCVFHSLDSTDKSVIYAIESAVIQWSHQVQLVLNKESSQPLLQGENPTPKVELEFWKSR